MNPPQDQVNNQLIENQSNRSSQRTKTPILQIVQTILLAIAVILIIVLLFQVSSNDSNNSSNGNNNGIKVLSWTGNWQVTDIDECVFPCCFPNLNTNVTFTQNGNYVETKGIFNGSACAINSTSNSDIVKGPNLYYNGVVMDGNNRNSWKTKNNEYYYCYGVEPTSVAGASCTFRNDYGFFSIVNIPED